MSGVDFEGRQIRKGAADAIEQWLKAQGGAMPPELQRAVDSVARQGATPLVVADGARALGVVELKDIVKGGIRERFAELRRMGITHRDDHRRQQADRCRDRGRSGCR